MKIIFWGHGEDWLPCMLGDIDKVEEAIFVNNDFPIDYKSQIFRRLVRGFVLNPKVPYCLQSFFFKQVAKTSFPVDIKEKFIVVFFDWNRLGASRHFLRFIRAHYPNVKMVYIFTNIVKISGATIKYHTIDDLNNLYDIVYTFEVDDAKEYGFKMSPLFNASYKLPASDSVENRVFFVGVAKDRYPKLMKVYMRLEEIGVKQLFYISQVNTEEIKPLPGIIYNKKIPYRKTQELEQSSTCLLDIVQGGAKGYTLKVRSAVCNDKLLITNNPYVKQAPFYNPDYILFIEKPEDITPSFFDNPFRVSYTQADKNYFSLVSFVEQMKVDLSVAKLKNRI